MGKPIKKKVVSCSALDVQSTKSSASIYSHSDEDRITLERMVGYLEVSHDAADTVDPWSLYITFDRAGANAIDIDPGAYPYLDDDREAETILWVNGGIFRGKQLDSGKYKFFVDLRSKRKMRKDDVIKLNGRTSVNDNNVAARWHLTLFFKETN